MDNKKLSILLIIIVIFLSLVIFSFDKILEENRMPGATCQHENIDSCPYKERPWQTYLGVALISGIFALAIYLMFFEKSQKEIVESLNNHKNMKLNQEKFEILLKGMGENEQKIMKAVKEQDGISQQTLRLRTDMHKSKLSIVLSELERKNLIKRIVKGKTKQVFMKIAL